MNFGNLYKPIFFSEKKFPDIKSIQLYEWGITLQKWEVYPWWYDLLQNLPYFWNMKPHLQVSIKKWMSLKIQKIECQFMDTKSWITLLSSEQGNLVQGYGRMRKFKIRNS